MVAAPTTASLRSLCNINRSILGQKLGLFSILKQKFGADKDYLQIYQSTCPLVGATMGQHVRHIMDHVELAVLVASTYKTNDDDTIPQLHYDLRVRGGTLEHDMDLAQERIENVSTELQHLSQTLDEQQDSSLLLQQPVQANFMLTADKGDAAVGLISTVGRELGFSAHHAIHHMAMIRLIAIHHVGLDPKHDLPPDFGRAPSTVQHDLSN